MDLAKRIWAITPSRALDLEERGKRGDSNALCEWALYAVWKKISNDRTIPAKKKRAAFRELIKVKITVEYSKPSYVPPRETILGR